MWYHLELITHPSLAHVPIFFLITSTRSTYKFKLEMKQKYGIINFDLS
jgi:hypothetical protein